MVDFRTSLHLIFVIVIVSGTSIGLSHTFETDQDNNAAKEGLKDTKTGLSKGIPFSFPCARLPNLQNADILCGGKMCLIQCHEGYRPNLSNAFVYICNLSTGIWSTLPKGKKLPWKNCVKKGRKPKLFNSLRPVHQKFQSRKMSKSKMDPLQEVIDANTSKLPLSWGEEEDENLTWN